MNRTEHMRELVRQAIDEQFGKPKPPADVPIIHFDAPEVTTQRIVQSVFHGKGEWKTLALVAVEDEATKLAKKLSDRYDMTEIPKPIFDDEDWHL